MHLLSKLVDNFYLGNFCLTYTEIIESFSFTTTKLYLFIFWLPHSTWSSQVKDLTQAAIMT